MHGFGRSNLRLVENECSKEYVPVLKWSVLDSDVSKIGCWNVKYDLDQVRNGCPPTYPPPLVVPPPLSFPGGGGGGGPSLGQPKFFVAAHCVVVWVTVLWGTTTCIPCTHGRTFCSLSLKWNLMAQPCFPLGQV